MLTTKLFQSLLLTIFAFSSVLIANSENNMSGDLGRFGWSEWRNCDFTGSDIAELSNLNTKDQCGNECYKNTECTHFTWTAKNGHVCFLKHFENPPLLPTHDFDNIQCGWISPPSRGSQPEIQHTPTPQWNDDIGGVKWTTSCFFNGPDGSLLKTTPFRTAELCRADCAALSNCTHFNWSSNGNCELKHFNFSVPAYSFDGTICGSVTRPSVTPLTTPAGAETTQSSNTTYPWISSTTQAPLSPGQDRFSDTIKYSIIGVVLPFAACLLCLLGRMIYLNKKRDRSVRFARERLLGSGDLERINPELSIEEQVDLLPYDLKWEFPRNRIILGKQLGAGQFGVVYQAKQIGSVYNPKDLNPRTVAVNMAKSTLNLSGLECLASELKILIHLGPHLNLVNLLGACTKGIVNGEILVIEEFCFYGNLRDYLVANRDSFINEITADESSSVINANGAHSHLNSGEPRELQEDNKGQCMCQSRENPMTSSSIESWTSHLKPTVSNTASAVLFKKCNQDTRNSIVSMNDYGCTMPSEDCAIKLEGNLPTNCGVDISTRDLIYWSSQITSGMNHLASRKVIHGDLAARNVLLAEGNVVKIADFGLSRQIKYNYETYMKKNKDEALPVKWMAIESLKDQVFTRQSDVWSFGVVLWELFSLGNMPYPDVVVWKDLVDFLQRGERLEKPSFMPDPVSAIMAKCWANDPKLRPTFSDLEIELGKMLDEESQSHYIKMNNYFMCLRPTTLS